MRSGHARRASGLLKSGDRLRASRRLSASPSESRHTCHSHRVDVWWQTYLTTDNERRTANGIALDPRNAGQLAKTRR